MTGENTETNENTEEQNLENAETSETEEGVEEPENEEVDFSAFEKQMRESGGAEGSFDMDTVFAAAKKPVEESSDEQEGEEEAGEEGAEEEGAEGKKEGDGGDAGEKAEDTKYTKGGRLPKGIQSRMNRMKRKYETEIEGLKAQIESKGGEKEGDGKGGEATKGMPMVDEFDTVEAWMDAYDKWEEAAKGGEETSKGGTDDKGGKGSEETEETEETDADDNPDPAYADMIEMLEDIDADSDDEDELSAQVQDLVESGRMALSDTMIEFVLELEEDAQVRKVVDWLTARPSRSKAIARKSPADQIERLESVVKEPVKKTATRRKVPNQSQIHSQNKTVTPLEDEEDFSKFEARMRKKQRDLPDFLTY